MTKKNLYFYDVEKNYKNVFHSITFRDVLFVPFSHSSNSLSNIVLVWSQPSETKQKRESGQIQTISLGRSLLEGIQTYINLHCLIKYRIYLSFVTPSKSLLLVAKYNSRVSSWLLLHWLACWTALLWYIALQGRSTHPWVFICWLLCSPQSFFVSVRKYDNHGNLDQNKSSMVMFCCKKSY